ncbi:MAG: trimethylamine methyltransferase family protein [bacterium]|nr:trimethylamine methyltransferase family protein [bacterium]
MSRSDNQRVARSNSRRSASLPATVPRREWGGRFSPLDDTSRDTIIDNAFSILERIGMASAPDWFIRLASDDGARRRGDGRLLFPRPRVEKALARAARSVAVPGFVEDRGIDAGSGLVHTGTGGAAIDVLDAATGRYRDSTLHDLLSIMRVVDACPNVHYGIRPLVARDMTDTFELDINTAYACLAGTSKPIGTSFAHAAHVAPVVSMFDRALETEGGFHRQPFCMAVVVHAVSPLRYAPDGVDIMRAAIAEGMPLQTCSAGQAGATSPVTLAGALAQGLAETLAGLMVVDLLKPGHHAIHAFMPFISDLRTGAMSGGGGESAIANAAAAQLLRHLQLPSTVAAGMTDSKEADVQAGYEKAYTIALAAHAGADMINLSVGMLGSITVASPEALVIDDEMLGAILRSVRGVDVTPEAIDLDAMERVVCGDGHYLGEPQTLALMKSEYVYPCLGDRRGVHEWIESGPESIWERARSRVTKIAGDPAPAHLEATADQAIRSRFPIRLPGTGDE